MWNSLKKAITKGVEWTRVEARVGTGIPDINGVISAGEFWLENKVCDTKRFKTVGLWRPNQVAWQYNRARIFRNVWNVISHPATDTVRVYRCDKIYDLNDPDMDVPPDLVMEQPFDWKMLMDLVAEDLATGRVSTAMDECADG